MHVLSYHPMLPGFNLGSDIRKGEFYLAGDHPALRAAAVYQNIERAIHSYKQDSASLDDRHARFLFQQMKAGADERRLKQIAERYEKAHQSLTDTLSEHILRWGQENERLLAFLAPREAGDRIYLPTSAMHNAPYLNKLRALANSLGLVKGGRVRYTSEGENLVRQAEAALEGKHYPEKDTMRKLVLDILDVQRADLVQRKDALAQAVRKLEATNYTVNELLKYGDEATPPILAELIKNQNTLVSLANDVKAKSEAVVEREKQITYVMGLREFGLAIPRQNYESGKPHGVYYAEELLAHLEAEELLHKAAGMREYRKGSGKEGVDFKSGQYAGLTPAQVPIDYLLWVARGAEIIREEKQYRSETGKYLHVPVTFQRYRNAFARDGNMRRFVQEYLRTPAGKRRLEALYHDTHDENIKVLLGAVPELEELSRRTESTRRAAKPRLVNDPNLGAAVLRQVLASAQLFMRRNQYRGVYRETYQQKLRELLVPLMGAKEDPKEINQIVQNLLAEAPHSARVRRAKAIAQAKARKAYEKELAKHGLDDYSVLYRHYLGAGFAPEEAQEAAERGQKKWQTPSAYVGRGQRKQERESLEAEEQAAEKVFLRELAAKHPEVLSPATLARIDPNWRSQSGDWYAFKSKAAWNAWRRMSARLDKIRGGLEPRGEDAIANQLKRLEELEKDLIRKFVHNQEDVTEEHAYRNEETGEIIVEKTTVFSGEGELKQPIHPAVDTLHKDILETRAKLELMLRNLHASGETMALEPDEMTPETQEQEEALGFPELLKEETSPYDPTRFKQSESYGYKMEWEDIDRGVDQSLPAAPDLLQDRDALQFPGRSLVRLWSQTSMTHEELNPEPLLDHPLESERLPRYEQKEFPFKKWLPEE